jgi:lycopene cyclase domain-containing protein
MKAAYLLIDAVSAALPLCFARSERFGFGRAWPRALAAVVLAGVPFAAWDIAFARAGVWDFNPRYVLGPAALGLPCEEWLFFLAIPFACLFLYRQFSRPRGSAPRASALGPAAAPDPVPPSPRRPGRVFVLAGSAAALALALLASLHADRVYTSWVGWAGALAAAGLASARPRFARPFLAALALQYVPFLVVNGLLTALPVVRYRPGAILGPRILSIPFEDAVYAFVMFVASVSVFEILGRRPPAPENGIPSLETPVPRKRPQGTEAGDAVPKGTGRGIAGGKPGVPARGLSA